MPRESRASRYAATFVTIETPAVTGSSAFADDDNSAAPPAFAGHDSHALPTIIPSQPLQIPQRII